MKTGQERGSLGMQSRSSPTRLLGAAELSRTDAIRAAMVLPEARKGLCEVLAQAFSCSTEDIVDLYADRAIIRGGSGELYEVPYTIDDQGKVPKRDATKIGHQIEYVAVQSSSRVTGAVEEEGPPEEEGFRWRVQIVEAGPDKQNIANYNIGVLHAAAPVYEGAKVFALSQGQHTAPENPYGKSVRDLVGWISNVAPNATGLEGTLNILKNAAWLRDLILDAWRRGKRDLVGLSHDVIAQTVPGRFNSDPRQVERIVRVDSVDVVYEPIAGGRILRMAAAAQAGRKETMMDEQDKKLLEEGRIAAARVILTSELSTSGLPDLTRDKIEAEFSNRTFTVEELRSAITREKEYLDKITGSGIVTGFGQVRVGSEGPERIQAAMDKLFGVELGDNFKEIRPFTSLRAAYTEITGDTEVRGIPSRAATQLGQAFMEFMRLPAAYATSSFSFALGNTMYRRMVQDYNGINFDEGSLISFKRNARDFRTIEAVRVGYFGDLPDVDPETADYSEVENVTDEEVSYTVNQKGIILTVTRKTIINDDIRTVQTLVSRLARAAKRTHARRGWAKIIDNATYKADSKALFHEDHNNLGAVGLTNDATGIATLTARLTAMFNQTEKDSGELLALEGYKLWVPRALYEIAVALNSPWPIAGTINPHAGRFGTNHERIIINKLTTDASDWGLIGNPAEVELMEVAYLNGQEQPELFVSDNPLVGQMFVADKIQYKMRHEYEWEIVDYRGFDKSVVG